MLKRANEMIAQALQPPIALVPHTEWDEFVCAHLLLAREAVVAIKLLNEKDLEGPIDVVTRYLFELAVNLKYIANDLNERFPAYLAFHSLSEGQNKHDELIAKAKEQGDWSELARSGSTRRPWKPLAEMCEDVGLEYDRQTFYRVTSDIAHGGGASLIYAKGKLYQGNSRPEWQRAGKLAVAFRYYQQIAEVVTTTFSDISLIDATWEKEWVELMRAIDVEMRSFLGST